MDLRCYGEAELEIGKKRFHLGARESIFRAMSST
jgi:hypothetical protein